MAEKKIAPSDLEKQADALVKAGKMPDAKKLLSVIAGVRKKYAPQIEKARKRGA